MYQGGMFYLFTCGRRATEGNFMQIFRRFRSHSSSLMMESVHLAGLNEELQPVLEKSCKYHY